jgi:glucose-1-phosphate thymidylyltransferase
MRRRLLQGVILAAGRGKRLHPITENRTKAMAPILGIPIVERVMEPLVSHGIREFIIVISPEDAEIVRHFESQTKIDADIFLVTQNEPLGMGHALKQAARSIHEDFILSACDNLVKASEIMHLLEYWHSERPDAVLTTLLVEPKDIVRMGIVAVKNDRVTHIVEKPPLQHAPSNIGSVPLYIFSQEFLSYLDNVRPSIRGELELQDAIQMMVLNEENVRPFQITSRNDLTTPEDLLGLNLLYFAKMGTASQIPLNNLNSDTHFIHPVYIEADVKIGSDCHIGPNVYLEKGCVIGEGVRLMNTMVLRNREIADATAADHQLFC